MAYVKKYVWVPLVVVAVVSLGMLSACPKRLPHKQAYKPAAGERPGPGAQTGEELTPEEAARRVKEAEGAGEATAETGEAPTEEEAVAESAEEEPAEEEAKPETTEEESGATAPEPPRFVAASDLEAQMKDVTNVAFETEGGTFIIAVYPEIAPISANHFLDLVRAGFYDGIVIHRVEPGFVVQMGRVTDPDSAKFRYTQEPIKDEPNYSENMPMTVAFAKQYASGQKQPNSASTQFFINLGDNRNLDIDFTVMGKVIHGRNIVSRLSVGDRIGRAYILDESSVKDLTGEIGKSQ